MQSKVTYGVDMTAGQLIDLIQSGQNVVCPKCNGDLVMLSGCDAAKHGVHDGIYCENSPEHVQVVVDVAAPASFWDQFPKKAAGQAT